MKQHVKKPVISEKSMSLAQSGWFTFVVDTDSTKSQVKAEIEKLFKVSVVKVRTMIVKGSMKRTGRKRTLSRISDFKKAMVKLKKDQTIDLFSAGDTPTEKS